MILLPLILTALYSTAGGATSYSHPFLGSRLLCEKTIDAKSSEGIDVSRLVSPVESMVLTKSEAARVLTLIIQNENGRYLKHRFWSERFKSASNILYRGMRLTPKQLTILLQRGIEVSQINGEIDMSEDPGLAMEYAFSAGNGFLETDLLPRLSAFIEIDRTAIPFDLDHQASWKVVAYKTVPATAIKNIFVFDPSGDESFPFVTIGK